MDEVKAENTENPKLLPEPVTEMVKNPKISRKTFIISFTVVLVLGAVLEGLSYFLINPKQNTSHLVSPQGGTLLGTSKLTFSLEVSEPDNNSVVYDSNLSLSGKTLPNAKILIISNSQDLVVKSGENGEFSTKLSLNKGVNRIKVVAFDDTGDQRTVEKNIYFSDENL